MSTLLITGATGFIGSRLAAQALTRGHVVRTLTRRDWASEPAVPVDRRYFGTFPEQIPIEAVEGADAVVHCAAELEGSERAIFAVNVDGTVRLADLARRAGVGAFVFLSSQSARPDATSAYGRSKLAAEQRLGDLAGLQTIILRPGLVTGPGSRGLFRRMTAIVESLPVIPLLGGGRSIVQPIHVDDLCVAILRSIEMAPELGGAILHLGDPQGVSLAEFLRGLARTKKGRSKRTLSIPLWPVELMTGAAEALGIRLPINSDNLKGMKIVERMETAGDLARLGLTLRPWFDGVQHEESGRALSPGERAVRMLLIGAGRIGLVHAVTLSRLDGAVLSGIVDPKPGATGLLRGMGVRAPTFRSLEDAFGRAKPDAAVIATPASTHLPIARACLAHGLAAVMVEKPLAIRREQLVEYERLAAEFPGRPIQVGYVMPRNPQVAVCLERLRAGAYGRVRSFLGITLLTLIQDSRTNRWEVKKDTSGGGAYINAGGHVLSMIRAAFGDPEGVEAEHARIHSSEVEDSLVATFRYPAFGGKHYCSWSIGGYPRQENRLVIRTDRGLLLLTASVGVFAADHGTVEITHQLDFDVGFNLAPDYAGAGFTGELTDLRDAARTGRVGRSMDLAAAVGLESLLFRVYDVSREVRAFERGEAPIEPLGVGTPVATEPARADATGRVVRRVLDLRDLSTERVHSYLGEAGKGAWDEYLLKPAQLRGLPEPWRRGERLRVTVPDFLTQSRLLSNGRHLEVLKQMGVGGLTAAARAGLSVVAKERGPTFWVAAMALLGAGLRAVPPAFEGLLLLHGYLADFALALRRIDLLERMLGLCRRRRPRSRVGFHTNMASEAPNALQLLEVPVDAASILSAPAARDVGDAIAAIRRGARRPLAVTAEVGLAPSVVHRAALAAADRWAFGADAVLIGVTSDPVLAREQQAEVERGWASVFPGAAIPEGIL